MNKTIVPSLGNSEPAGVTVAVLDRLLGEMAEMSPELRKAARYVLDNPNDVGVSSIREIAEAAKVKPNSFVRMARAVGFEGYEDFRAPFREAIRSGGETFPDRARWLQSIAEGGRHGSLFTEMAATTLANVEQTFANTSSEQIKAAADRIVEARRTYVVGVGLLHPLAQQFAYLARMAVDSIVAVPRDGSLLIDDILRAGPEDVVLAMTFEPYRNEVIEAVRCAREQGARVIVLTDGWGAPVVPFADQAFVMPTETPQFFTSSVAVSAFLETLMAFVVADADKQVIASIEKFHRRRQELGVYWTEGN